MHFRLLCFHLFNICIHQVIIGSKSARLETDILITFWIGSSHHTWFTIPGSIRAYTKSGDTVGTQDLWNKLLLLISSNQEYNQKIYRCIKPGSNGIWIRIIELNDLSFWFRVGQQNQFESIHDFTTKSLRFDGDAYLVLRFKPETQMVWSKWEPSVPFQIS